jgi:hypothetical protein
MLLPFKSCFLISLFQVENTLYKLHRDLITSTIGAVENILGFPENPEGSCAENPFVIAQLSAQQFDMLLLTSAYNQ